MVKISPLKKINRGGLMWWHTECQNQHSNLASNSHPEWKNFWRCRYPPSPWWLWKTQIESGPESKKNALSVTIFVHINASSAKHTSSYHLAKSTDLIIVELGNIFLAEWMDEEWRDECEEGEEGAWGHDDGHVARGRPRVQHRLAGKTW